MASQLSESSVNLGVQMSAAHSKMVVSSVSSKGLSKLANKLTPLQYMKETLPCKTFGSATSSQLLVKLQLYFANHFLQLISGKSFAKENDFKLPHKVDGSKGTPRRYGFYGFFKLVNYCSSPNWA